jgi:hypothetical protein
MGILCDFHGTLVDANAAWISAFESFGIKTIDNVFSQVYKKTNRKIICSDLGLDYTEVTNRYRDHLEIRKPIVDFIKKLSTNNEIIIISNSSRNRLMLDIEKVHDALGFNITDIFSKENGNKNDIGYIESILDSKGFKSAYIIGNDIREDFNPSNRIINIFVPYKDTILLNESL